MESEISLAVIIGAISGLYYAIYKNHGCIKRIETKLDAHFDMEFMKEELVDVKDAVRQLKDG